MKFYLTISIILITFLYCSAPKDALDDTPRVRSFSKWKADYFHHPIEVKIGWYPYEEEELVKTGKHQYSIQKSDTSETGSMPVIVLTYPDSTQSVYFGMDIDNELLGRLIKQSLMTQQPITEPLIAFLEDADCSTCHPEDIEIK
ncbi:MAG: hypothetical protein KJN64_01735 [Ignavibacteria bacterium]|nr:hypothetical protein [Ignavibacteria bacterium]MBT8392275.1 hypothetical protein [Ignavibacteria bacterium]NNJ53621.1 hypothetical protein [Ignavibacteriaceae bacterium]NNL20390.1 hypothetical protein [Ignavibacteriaceae bacterium]